MSTDESIRKTQAVIDSIVSSYEKSRRRQRTGPVAEHRIRVPMALWNDLHWLEDGSLSEAVDRRGSGAYAEGEQMGDHYVFFVGGLDLAALLQTVQELLESRHPGVMAARIVRQTFGALGVGHVVQISGA